MIVKKLRAKRGWSQEQLAVMSGLNVRTIQRIESGNKASLETLKCLASVFEIDVTILQEEVTVIDKDSKEWKALPWWYRINFIGVKTRKSILVIEVFCLTLGLIYLYLGDLDRALVGIIAAYIYGWIIRYGDRKLIW